MTELALLSDAPVIAMPGGGLCLDLGCGQNPKDGFEGVDLYSESAKHKVNLFKFPFPWDDDTVQEIWCSHFIEHIPAREVEERDLHTVLSSNVDIRQFVGQDFLCAFMDECWRILKPDGKMTIIVPNVWSDGAFQDPTHRRFINRNTFAYFTKSERERLKLDHYRIRCNFEGPAVPVGSAEYSFRHGKAQEFLFGKCLNTIWEYHVTLTAKK